MISGKFTYKILRRLTLTWPGVALCLCLVAGTALAEGMADNDQTVVVGMGVGIHTYAGSDDIRRGLPQFGGSDAITNAGMAEVFVDWFALGTLGVGLRDRYMSTSRMYSGSGTTIHQTVDVDMGFVTVTWVPLGATSYARLGIMGGVGNAQYTASQTATGQPDTRASTHGSADLLGIYLDWGGEGFGARVGFDSVRTSLADLVFPGSAVRNKVDASGNTAYFDLRWAW